MNASSPTHAASCFRTDAPFAYVMPSKFSRIDCVSGTSVVMACVVGSWSCWYAHVFSPSAKDTHPSRKRVASARARVETYVANDSFSHTSSHHRIVTRSPNHMWASSCRTVSARRSRAASVTFDRNRYSSLNVTHAAFSMAPARKSGTNSWSYFAPNGYG